jgi:hypothetical protein
VPQHFKLFNSAIVNDNTFGGTCQYLTVLALSGHAVYKSSAFLADLQLLFRTELPQPVWQAPARLKLQNCFMPIHVQNKHVKIAHIRVLHGQLITY